MRKILTLTQSTQMTKVHLKLSKFLSFVLRHEPQFIGLSITSDGWVDVDELITKMNFKNSPEFQLTIEILSQIVHEDSKQRYTFNDETKSKIRASQGHSIPIDLGLQPKTPPRLLYHGTYKDAIDSIFSSGLKPMQRHHVHLSDNLTTASQVGSRRGEPVILLIDSGLMHSDGISFFQSKNKVWLTDFVDKKYLSFLN